MPIPPVNTATIAEATFYMQIPNSMNNFSTVLHNTNTRAITVSKHHKTIENVQLIIITDQLKYNKFQKLRNDSKK